VNSNFKCTVVQYGTVHRTRKPRNLYLQREIRVWRRMHLSCFYCCWETPAPTPRTASTARGKTAAMAAPGGRTTGARSVCIRPRTTVKIPRAPACVYCINTSHHSGKRRDSGRFDSPSLPYGNLLGGDNAYWKREGDISARGRKKGVTRHRKGSLQLCEGSWARRSGSRSIHLSQRASPGEPSRGRPGRR
jgi:hypothetical protein